MNKQERKPLLFLKLLHELYLVGMNIPNGKSRLARFLRVETNRYPLNNTHIIHRAFLAEIGLVDGACGIVYGNGRYRRGKFLNQRKTLFPICLIRQVHDFFQRLTPKASGAP